MNKVALIIPYFGKWPEWINLYLFSCSRQKNIDFLFYTDCEIPEKTYYNTVFKQMTFDEYCKFVSRRLGITFCPSNAYKLCDLKAFYGVVHEDDIRDYEWWGFGDIDLIYGDLSLLLNEHNMKRNDVLTTHVDRIAGHFTVIRKESAYTRLCFKIPDWKEMLCEDRNRGMDERWFTSVAMPLQYKLAKKIYYTLIRRLTSPNSRYYWFDKLGRCVSWIKSSVYMKEYFTSFVPAPESVCTYDLHTGDIQCPTRQISKIIAGGVRYTYISFSSKRHSICRLTTIGAADSIGFPGTMTSQVAA